MAEKTEDQPLTCGGRGPCCHIGYPHRHCEHCDMVISLHQCAPNPLPWYVSPRPYWSSGTTSQPTATPLPGPMPIAANVFAALANNHACEKGA